MLLIKVLDRFGLRTGARLWCDDIRSTAPTVVCSRTRAPEPSKSRICHLTPNGEDFSFNLSFSKIAFSSISWCLRRDSIPNSSRRPAEMPLTAAPAFGMANTYEPFVKPADCDPVCRVKHPDLSNKSIQESTFPPASPLYNQRNHVGVRGE